MKSNSYINTKILGWILAISAILFPITSYADQIGVVMDFTSLNAPQLKNIGTPSISIYDLSGKSAKDANTMLLKPIYTLLNVEINNATLLTPNKSPIELVFGANTNLIISGSAYQIKTIDLNRWSDKANPITVDLYDAINPKFIILDRAKEYRYSDANKVLPGKLNDGVINFKIYTDQIFGLGTSSPFAKIANVNYQADDVNLTLDCGYNTAKMALVNSIATNFISEQNNNKLIFDQPGKYISLSGKNQGVNFLVKAGTMELKNQNTSDASIQKAGTLILTNIFTGNIDGDRDGIGHLILNENANIKGEIGKNTSLDSITLNGQHMIYGWFRSKIINIANRAVLSVKDKIDAKFITFSDDKGLLIYNKNATLVSVRDLTNSRQILVNGQYEAADNVNSILQLYDAGLYVNNNVNLYKSINVQNGKKGSISFKGNSSIFNDIGFLNYYTSSNLTKSKITIFLQPKSKVTTNFESNIYGDVILEDQSELTINGDIYGGVWQFVLNKYGECDGLDHGHLVLNAKANVYGSVGKKGARLVSITVNKASKPNIIKGDVFVDAINIKSSGALSIGGKINANSLEFADDNSALIYNVGSTLVPLNKPTNSRQILNTGIYTADKDVLSKLNLQGATLLYVNDGVNLHKPVVTVQENSIVFKGRSKISADIGSSTILLEANSKVTAHNGVKIKGAVNLGGGSQLTIPRGGYLSSADGKEAKSGGVIANPGSEIGDIGAVKSIKQFSANGATLSGKKYDATNVILSGTNTFTNPGPVVIKNLNTADNTIINAVGGSLTITGKDTKISNNTTIALDMVEDALVFDNGINKDNFDGDINITFSSDATSVALLESTTINNIHNRDILLKKPVVRMNQVPSDVLKIVATEQNLFRINCHNGNITVAASKHLSDIVSSLGPSIDGGEKIDPILAQIIVNESKSGASANQSYGNDTRLPVASQVISDTKTSPSIPKQAYAPIDMLRVAQSVASMMDSSLAINMDLANLDHLSRSSALKFFISPLVGMLSLPLSADVVATTSQIGGVVFGAFYNLTNYQTNIGLALTIAGSYTKDTSKSKGAISGISALSAFIRKKFDNKLMLDVIATMHKMSESLNQLLFDGDYKGSSQIRFISILPKIGYEISLNNEITFIPHIGAYINYCNRDAVTLKSSKNNSLSLISDKQTKQQYLLLAGAKLASSGEYRSWHLQPFIDVNFYWNFKSSVDEGVTTLKSSGGNEVLQLLWNYCKDRPILLSGRLGLQVKTDNGFNTVLSVDANFAGNWCANVVINYHF